MADSLQELNFRYGETFRSDTELTLPDLLKSMIGRGSCRDFNNEPIDAQLIQLLCGIALAAPTKSDLQQRDIVIIQDPKVQKKLTALMGAQSWISSAPNIAVFCGNNRRQRLLHEMRGHPFVNDHLDAFFNAAVDAGIALSAFVTAAEALGLGCCPISAIRNEAAAVSDLLGLPDHVFPAAGLAFGFPKAPERVVSMRLPLASTVHLDRYSEENIEEIISDYDNRREAKQPYSGQRAPDRFGKADKYGWSEDKSRQYTLPERSSFGQFIRAKGFDLS